MATEEYQAGYEAGHQDGWNAAQQPQAEAENRRFREALERIADPRNKHFSGDAQVVASAALVAQPPPSECVITVYGIKFDVVACYRSNGFNCLPQTLTVTGEVLRSVGNVPPEYSVVLNGGIVGIDHQESVPVRDGDEFFAVPPATGGVGYGKQPQAEAVQVHRCTGAGDTAIGAKADCQFCAAPQQAEAVPPGYVLVPLDVLQAASESLGSFVSDQGWTTLDMQAMDNLDAILAQQKGGV